MNRLLLQALSCICFAAPLGVLLLLEGPQILNSLPTLFVALCCGVGLAAGIASASAGSSTAEEQRETLVPQQLQCRFKQDLGLNYNEDALVRDHVTEFKYLGLLLFLFRLTVNIKALYLNVVAVCTVELPETVGSVARVLEAGIFLEHLCKLPIELLSVLLAGSPCPCISTVKTLAGFSSMRFLRIEALGVAGLIGEAASAESFRAFMTSNLMQLIGFVNQVASAMNIQQEELHSLLVFLLGSDLKAQLFLDQVMRNFMKLPKWRWRLVTSMTFDAGGLQRMVRERQQLP
ncbi:unnamed protein product [Durusdinium trenchii]|uniref:Uncharacterized protein n=1 Tax=Durusdinium trenchii TaxID=1381693 RepID=A0ABP0NV10_9DINO